MELETSSKHISTAYGQDHWLGALRSNRVRGLALAGQVNELAPARLQAPALDRLDEASDGSVVEMLRRFARVEGEHDIDGVPVAYADAVLIRVEFEACLVAASDDDGQRTQVDLLTPAC
ncbi:MAG: hypothetical protein ACI835_004504 [Planctomycetota bacterium]